ncbi:hypothetical protein VN97_g9807 [Penicillium thymicola]|uniref:Uncharacterized protein n=1 Tax=Penicillium thymicola TaxID=293382 RepID=A0AAI9X4Y7_PENTH|nr:hypothetical protein VN97_g9807 [Penicillium thymicola]
MFMCIKYICTLPWPCQAPNNRSGCWCAPADTHFSPDNPIYNFMYLLYDLPIQKVLRHPVNITCIFSALELAKVIGSVRIYIKSLT